MQEAFVAALLAIARDARDPAGSGPVAEKDEIESGWVAVAGQCGAEDDEDLDDLVLWVEIKKQVAILREGMEKKPDPMVERGARY
jgi:hypothetical protein